MGIIDIFAGKKTRTSVYTAQSISNLLVSLAAKKKKYNVATKSGCKALHADLMKAMEVQFGVYDIPGILSSYGIGKPEQLGKEIIDNRDFLESVAKLNMSPIITESRLTKNQQKGKALVDEYGAGEDPYDTNRIPEDLERYVVCRTKYGTATPKMYTLHGPLIMENANAIRAMYAYETGCNYYETRPILYTTWINLPDEYKNASRPCEEDDLKDAVA